MGRQPGAKTLPHLVDSVLLLSALTLAWMLRLTPGNAPWLLAKIVGLVVYVALGVVALRPGVSCAVRAAAWVAALATVALDRHRSPSPRARSVSFGLQAVRLTKQTLAWPSCAPLAMSAVSTEPRDAPRA